MPSRCLITGTRASRLMRSIRPLPPRGTMTSTNSGMLISAPTASRSVVSTTCTTAAGKPASARPRWMQAAMARLEWMASEPPRRMVALPDLRHRLAASMVTFGRDS
ncbi:hypothetical protein D9M71_551660 [compost metagenome]